MDWRAVCLRAASASRAAVRDDSSMDWRANCSHLHSPPAAPVSNEWARLDTEAQVTRTHLPSRLKRDERPKAISQVRHRPDAPDRAIVGGGVSSPPSRQNAHRGSFSACVAPRPSATVETASRRFNSQPFHNHFTSHQERRGDAGWRRRRGCTEL
jgi:hypothetical protein